jgi:hypothetical protein
MDWYLSTLREEITRSREMLAPLEAGKIRMGEHAPGEPWRDCTQERIDGLKQTITMYETLIERLEHRQAP